MSRLRIPTLAELGLRPSIGEDMDSLLHWLNTNRMTDTAAVLDRPQDQALPGAAVIGQEIALALATSRHPVRPMKQDELKALKERFKGSNLEGISPEAMWAAVRDAEASVRTLAWERLPADAMAFYRPFHFPPFDQWGIYLLVGPLLHYHRGLVQQSGGLRLFSPETLMHLVLFEVFNHEFFHHLVESTATTLEILLATQGNPQPLYLQHRAAQMRNSFGHPHAPLEEALANAYAYNALGFISRVKAGFKTASVKAYQKAVVKHWCKEPPGYRDAHYYAGAGYVDGGAVLLGELLQKPGAMNDVPLAVVAKRVMPSGFSALMAKPDVPTWLVGSPAELALFNALVPAPNEAYTQLFWPYNTDRFDQFIELKQAEEKAKKAALLAARRAQGAAR
jgi:hypothetical protein